VFFVDSVVELVVFVALTLTAVASAAVVTVTGSLGLAAQRFEFVPRLQVFTIEGFHDAFSFFAFDQNHDLIGHGQNIDHLAFPFGCDDSFIALGQLLAGFHILLVFVNQTAAQTTAHASNLIGSEGDALVLGHFDRNGGKIRQELGAAAGFETTGAHTADNLGHIAWTDLPHFDLAVWIQTVHVFFQGFEVDLLLALRAEQEGKPRPVKVILGSYDLYAPQTQLSSAGAAVDHGFSLFGLPGLKQQQVTRRSAPLHGPPAALRLIRYILDDLNDLSKVFSPGSVNNDMLTDAHIGDGGSIEMVDLAYFGETYTDNIWIHEFNYTVSEI
jgi:hypothetical protein